MFSSNTSRKGFPTDETASEKKEFLSIDQPITKEKTDSSSSSQSSKTEISETSSSADHLVLLTKLNNNDFEVDNYKIINGKVY